MTPSSFDAVIFDMDGVVTDTARLHASAWKRLFDEYLEQRAARGAEPFRAFDERSDYLAYVDGKPRYDGVRSFLESRGIEIPFGSAQDGPDRETACGLGNRKDRYFEERIDAEGVSTVAATVERIYELRGAGVRVAVVTSSKHGREVLQRAGLVALFDALVDGTIAAELELEGKPRPDIFLEAARRLEVEPSRAVVVEDAVSGVEAGRRGGFGLVVGLDRGGNRLALQREGADVVVDSLAALPPEQMEAALVARRDRPSALASIAQVQERLLGKRAAVFLDYDGTLTPIVERPEQAVLSEATRGALMRLARVSTLAIVSGRSLREVRHLVGLENLHYAGNHGLEIEGPADQPLSRQRGGEFLPVLQEARRRIAAAIEPIAGAWVEDKSYSLSVHHRQVDAAQVSRVERAVDEAVKALSLRKHHGKKVFEVRPRLEWDKGRAVLWLLEVLGLDGPEALPFYLGDDVTDEDAFRVLAGRGIGVRVGRTPLPTAAQYSLRDPAEVQEFLAALARALEREC